MRRRPKGAGRRPGDTSVRLSAETMQALEQLRRLTYRGGSADTLIRELLDAEILRRLPRIRPTSGEVHTTIAANA